MNELERELRILREAIRLKIASAKVSDLKGQSEAHNESRSPFDIAGACMGLVRIIAARRDCHVSNVVNYLDDEETIREDKEPLRELRKVWPTREQWEQAASQTERMWRERTLAEAAYQLAIKNQRITPRDLAPLLFLNERCEVEWKLKEYLNGIPESYSAHLRHAKRGISLRLFRDRHKRADVDTALTKVEEMIQSKYNEGVDEKLKDRDALHLEHLGMERRPSDAAARAIRDLQRIIRETGDPTKRQQLEAYLCKLKREELRIVI